MITALLAAASAPLAPSATWNVHADDTQCVLSNIFGAGKDRTQVSFQPSIGGGGNGGLTLAILTAPRGSDQEFGEATVTRQPDGRKFPGRYYSTRTDNKQYRFTQLWVSNDIFEGLGTTKALRLRAGPIDVTVAIPASGKATAAFRACEDGLLQSWGIRPAAFREGRGPEPTRNVADFFRARDYPREALTSRFVGHVRAALVIGPDGVVRDCRVVTRIGPAFDKITCDQARKVPFSPGLDERGTPTQSLFHINVRWALGS